MKKNVIARVIACALAMTVTATGFTPVRVQAAGQTEVAIEAETAEDTEAVEEISTEAATETESVTEDNASEAATKAAAETAEDEAEETEPAEVTADEPEAVQAANSFENRQYGDNVYASLSNGTVTISGTGPMYENMNTSLLGGYYDYIRSVVIEDGVTSVADCLFNNCSNLNQITLPDSITKIGKYAFHGTGVRSFKAPRNLEEIGEGAFESCYSLQNIFLNDGLIRIDSRAFHSTGLREVVIPENCGFDTYTTFHNSCVVHRKTTITLNANGGTVSGASQKDIIQYENEAYGKPAKLPTPVRSGYDFLGWYDCTDYGVETAVTGQSVRAHALLRAKWCNHASKLVKGKKTATYEKDGYTGDTYCKTCGKRLSLGHTIDRKILKAPKISGVENVGSGLKVKWLKSKDAKGYYVYRNGKKYATVKKGTSYIDKKVKNNTGKAYSYKVCAYYGKATSNFSGTRVWARVASSSVSSVKNSAKKTVTVNWKKVAKCKGYQIQYTQDKKFEKKVTTKKVKKQSQSSRKLTKLTKGKKYYVRVRSYTTYNGKTYYSAWSSVKSTTVKK